MSIIFFKEFSEGVFETHSQRPEYLIHTIEQTHSSDIIEYKGSPTKEQKADGIIIDPKTYPNHAIAIKTADCLPILLLGEKIAMIHAGWRGLHKGILSNPMLGELNINKAFIGPSILTYEITEEFKQHFVESKNFTKEQGKWYFNLQNEAKEQLLKNFASINVDICNVCTLKDDKFHSFRRNQTNNRNWNIFKLN